MSKCPACLRRFDADSFDELAAHLCARAAQSDADHVRWLNQNVSRKKVAAAELTPSLRRFFSLGGGSLTGWITTRFISKFYGEKPHPFVEALQHPSRAVLLGYVVEHHHFLRQWVRSCAYIMARTDQPDVVHYELDNLNTEYGGFGPERVSHYELLLRMGEELGLGRAEVLAMAPLPATRTAIENWERIASQEPWVEGLAAMHSLELIANRNLVHQGARIGYFDPAILAGDSIPDAAKEFLREGYEADVGHSEQALELVTRYASEPGAVASVQATFLRSIDLFDDYLMARLERAEQFEGR